MRRMITRIPAISLGLTLLIASLNVQRASAAGDDERHARRVEHFASLPEKISPAGVAEGHPEGLCADEEGNIYADSFEQPVSGVYVQNYIYKFGRDGDLLSATPTPTGVVPLGCIISGDKFYMNDVYNGNEYVYTLPLSDSSVPDTFFHICAGFTNNLPGPVCGLNANYPGPDGRIYMSDNGAGLFGDFVGRIWVLDPKTGSSSVFLDSAQEPGVTAPVDPELAVADLPAADYVPIGTVLPYGPNGVAFSRDRSALYIANMSTSKIYKQELKSCWDQFNGCEPDGALTLFSNDPSHIIQGPDNMDFDERDHLFLASGQDQHVVELDRDGNIVGVFGQFFGLNAEGAPRGLLQPSGIIFSKGKIYIGNESNQSLLPAADNIDWSKLKVFTISKLDLDDRRK